MECPSWTRSQSILFLFPFLNPKIAPQPLSNDGSVLASQVCKIIDMSPSEDCLSFLCTPHLEIDRVKRMWIRQGSLQTTVFLTLQTQSLLQGTPCKSIFTPVLIAGSLFSLQGFPCKPCTSLLGISVYLKEAIQNSQKVKSVKCFTN